MFRKENIINTLIQLILWFLIFITPLISQILDNTPIEYIISNMKYSYGMPIIFLTVFYVNYFLFIPQLLFKKRNIVYVLSNIALVQLLIYLYGLYLIQIEVDIHEYNEGFRWTVASFMYMINILIILAAISQRSQQRNYKLEMRNKETQRSLAEQELHRLKSQLNPHFLFNTLNNISSLIGFNQDAAQDSMSRLSDMLRYVLYDSSVPTVPLNQEIHFLENYIDLMRLRYADTLQMRIDLPNDATNAVVAPLLYISLLENAFKYGATSRSDCNIDVCLQETDQQISFKIKNSLLPIDERRKKSGGGMGIDNLKKRLQLIYPQKHSLDYGVVRENDVEVFALSLTIDK